MRISDKIQNSATFRRLKKLIGAFFAAEILFLAVAIACLCFRFAGRFAAAALFFSGNFFCLAVWLYFQGILRKIKKRAGRYLFAETFSSSFECFGPFLALDVAFKDGEGKAREGRSRFLFSPRDVEPWQNVPLEIAYFREREEEGGKPDIQPAAEILILGTAEKSCKNSEK